VKTLLRRHSVNSQRFPLHWEDAMTTTAESVQLTQTGPGTVMGDLMRQYWIPAVLSSELERDGAPIRLMVLGEKLIAFRDSAGHAASWTIAARIAARRFFLGGMKKAESAASITVGNTMSREIASICQTCCRTRTSARRSKRRRTRLSSDPV
jgi:hypothetical protein